MAATWMDYHPIDEYLSPYHCEVFRIWIEMPTKSSSQHREIVDWCNENIGMPAYGIKRNRFYFKEESDAMAFKLRWL